jgi:Holliday junction resolvase RusA-like endonuclease
MTGPITEQMRRNAMPGDRAMKGWTIADLEAKGLRVVQTGGAAGEAPVEALVRPVRVKPLPDPTAQDLVAMAAKSWPASERLAIDLPAPPSLNNAYINTGGNGRAKSRALKQFYVDATAALANLNQRLDAETYRAHIVVTREHPRADIDGRLKFILDVLVKCGITVDDRFCEKATVEWRYNFTPGATVMLSKYRKRRAA